MRILVMLVIGAALIGGAWMYYQNSPSYQVSRQAQQWYDSGEYHRALELTERAVSADNYNRAAIMLRRDARMAWKLEQACESVEAMLPRVDRMIEQGQIEEAIEVSQMSIRLINDALAPERGNLERGRDLLVLAGKKIDKARKAAPAHWLRLARDASDRGEWRYAVGYLEKIDQPSREIRLLRSELAMKIARAELDQLLNHARAGELERHQVLAVLDWLKKIDPQSPQAQEAARIRERLERALQ